MRNRIGRRIVVGIALLFLVAGSAPAQSFPDGPGKDVFLAVCSSCHDPSHVIGKHWDKTQWTAKVLEMLQEEPDVTQPNREAIIQYLAKNFGPGPKVNVNKAAAEELAAALELPTKVAEAVVRYREANGSFKTPDDLKKVPGFDAAKIASLRERINF